MNKLLQCKINLSKIDKEKLFKGEKGIWLDIDIWFSPEPDQYGNNCAIKQAKCKDYLGNGKFYVPKETPEETPQSESISGLPF